MTITVTHIWAIHYILGNIIYELERTIAILNKQEYNYSIVNLSSSDNPLETVLNNYLLCLWTGFYLAKKIGVDPEEIELIERYKELKKNN